VLPQLNPRHRPRASPRTPVEPELTNTAFPRKQAGPELTDNWRQNLTYRTNRNVLVQGSQITAVIDWGNALYGDWRG
jgi:hypothetical protein